MKILWIVACWMTVAYCGVVPWSQSKEDEAMHLFRSYCLTANKGVSGDIKWFCKRPTNSLPDQTFDHYKVIKARPHNQKQVIFVQTPSRTYKHNVYVKGEADFNQDTHIYVVPGQDLHHVDIQGNIETKSGLEGKPHTFYLQNNPFDVGGNKYPHHHHNHHNDPYSPAFKPSYKPSAPDHYPSHTPVQPHDHYPSYTHTSPTFEIPPSNSDISSKFDAPSQEANPPFDYLRKQEEIPAQFDLRRTQEETPPEFNRRRSKEEIPQFEYRRPEEETPSRFEFRRPEERPSRFEHRRRAENPPRFEYRQSQEDTSRYDYRPPQFEPPRFSNHIRHRRRHFGNDDDIVTPHPDTVKKFSGFRNF